MSFFSYARVETRRLFRKKTTWLAVVFTILIPFTGYSLYQPAALTTRGSSLIANPALAGALGGSFLFAFLTLYELHQVRKKRVDALTDAVVSPAVLSLSRTLAAALLSIFSCVLTACAHLVFPAFGMGNVFDLGLYLSVYFTIMLPALLLSVLASSAFYQITCRFDLSLVLFVAFTLASLGGLVREDFVLRWVNPVVTVLSDDFGNYRLFQMTCYNRLFWFAVMTGVWLLSSLCIRRYGKKLAASLRFNLRKLYILLPALLLLAGGWYLHERQPFFDDSPMEVVYSDDEPEPDVSLLETHVQAVPDTRRGTLKEIVAYKLENRSGREKQILLSTNPGYSISSAEANGKPISWSEAGKEDLNEKKYALNLPPDRDIELTVALSGFPEEWSILKGFIGSMEIGGDYVCLVNEEFSPSLSAGYPGEGLPAIIADITLPARLTPVVSKGTVEPSRDNGDGTKTFRITGEGVYLQLFAGDFTRRRIEAAGSQVDFYYSAKHQRVMEEIGIDEILRSVFEYCAEHYGPFPYMDSETPFRLVELTAYQFGGWAGTGFSTMDENSFSEDGLKDPMKGASGNEVMAHEIIHQWWGLGRMFTDDTESGWSAEGMTVYTTYRMMKEKYGEGYAKENYVKKWKEQVDSYNNNFYVRHPEYLQKLPENYRAEILNRQSSVMEYCLIPLKILKAEKLAGGEEKMDAILSEIYIGSEESSPYLDYQTFLDACGLKEEDLEL